MYDEGAPRKYFLPRCGWYTMNANSCKMLIRLCLILVSRSWAFGTVVDFPSQGYVLTWIQLWLPGNKYTIRLNALPPSAPSVHTAVSAEILCVFSSGLLQEKQEMSSGERGWRLLST